jgi:diaminohydroxyphosphoribosylaminopyrimidine deaminase/5-amino-6-(5-phosphoribosylamino)uracil reductase
MNREAIQFNPDRLYRPARSHDMNITEQVLPGDALQTSEADDLRLMASALALSRRGLGRVAPNPAVGALLVKDGHVIGRGWTADGGRPHAETIALKQAGDAARGATLYVTLEPCSHHGRTPPCADAVIASGVTRVVSALEDPDARVAGQGHARLEAAGISVHRGVLAEEAARINRGHILRVTQNRPMVTLKLAQTADGYAAGAHGTDRLMITGAQANTFVHMQRALHDAVLVGAGTAAADDPLLTVRLPGVAANPVRIVLDSRLALSPKSRLAATANDHPTLLVTTEAADAEAAARLADNKVAILRVPADSEGHVDLAAALAALAQRGLTRIFCEGGPHLTNALLQNGLVDEIMLLTAAIPLQGQGKEPGILALDEQRRAALKDVTQFHPLEDRMIGGDHLQRFERSGQYVYGARE